MPLLTDIELRGIAKLTPETFADNLTLYCYGAAGRPTVIKLRFENPDDARRIYDALTRKEPTP